jgi:hypothetical protein
MKRELVPFYFYGAGSVAFFVSTVLVVAALAAAGSLCFLAGTLIVIRRGG